MLGGGTSEAVFFPVPARGLHVAAAHRTVAELWGLPAAAPETGREGRVNAATGVAQEELHRTHSKGGK